jgi:hypothetical protein
LTCTRVAATLAALGVWKQVLKSLKDQVQGDSDVSDRYADIDIPVGSFYLCRARMDGSSHPHQPEPEQVGLAKCVLHGWMKLLARPISLSLLVLLIRRSRRHK